METMLAGMHSGTIRKPHTVIQYTGWEGSR